MFIMYTGTDPGNRRLQDCIDVDEAAKFDWLVSRTRRLRQGMDDHKYAVLMEKGGCESSPKGASGHGAARVSGIKRWEGGR